jgi:hypothetical protein
MSYGILPMRYRAWLYNIMRDVDEMAFYVMEMVRPGWVGIKTDVVADSDGEVRLLIDTENPRYLNMAEALLLIRQLIRLVLQMDEGEKIKELEKHWGSKIGETAKSE